MAFSGLLAVLVLIHNTGGLIGAEVRSSIDRGNDAPNDTWPMVVQVRLADGNGKNWDCGGTILSKGWVMTSAHCLKRHPVDLLKSMIWAGAYNLADGAKRYRGISIFMINPGYQARGSGYIHDIVLVKLKTELKLTKNMEKVSLPSTGDTFGPSSECWIVGWGNIGTDVPLSGDEILQEVKIPIISHDECKAHYPELTSNMLCAGAPAGGKDTCQMVCYPVWNNRVFQRLNSDYGGSLMCRAAGGRYVQVGIMSYGSPDGCGLPDHPGVYTQVSKYLKFIKDYVHDLE